MADAQSKRMHLVLEAPIPTLLWRLAAPNAMATVVLTSVTVADAWFVGQLGTVALASLAIAFPFQTLIQMMAGGAIGGGVTSALSRAVGAGDKARADAVAWHAILTACAMSVLFTIVLGIFPATVFSRLGAQEAVLDGAVAYARIAFGGAIVRCWFASTFVRTVTSPFVHSTRTSSMVVTSPRPKWADISLIER